MGITRVRQKPPYIGILLKAIYLDEAKARGLRAALGAPADESDQLAHIEDALRARYAALDKFFELKSSGPDIWERRAKEIIAREFNIALDHPQWWRALTRRRRSERNVGDCARRKKLTLRPSPSRFQGRRKNQHIPSSNSPALRTIQTREYHPRSRLRRMT